MKTSVSIPETDLKKFYKFTRIDTVEWVTRGKTYRGDPDRAVIIHGECE